MCLELWENCLSLFFTCCLRLGGVCKADVPLRSERWLQKGICHHDYVGDCGTGKTVLPMADLEKEKLREEAECLSALFAASDLGLILFLPWGETLCQSGFHLLNKAWLCWSLRMTNAIWELSVNITVKIYCNIYRASPSLRQGPLGGKPALCPVPPHPHLPQRPKGLSSWAAEHCSGWGSTSALLLKAGESLAAVELSLECTHIN